MKDNTAAVHAQVPVEVASFLLNEKRPEIAKIELKQRINVLLVPNKSLETPHYKLERLKHDDPRLDNIEASYTMAEEVEDPTTVTRRSQEPTNRQTPVIKGVLPDAPAPASLPKAEPAKTTKSATKPNAKADGKAESSGGFFAWLKRLFGGESAAKEEPTPNVGKRGERTAKEGDRSERGERNGERRGGRGGRGGRRGDRADRNDASTERNDKGERQGERSENNEARPPRENTGNRRGDRSGQRGERHERRDSAQANNAVDAPNGGTDSQDTGNTEVRNESRSDRAPRGDGRRERGEGRRERGGERGERRNEGGRQSVANDLTANAQTEMPFNTEVSAAGVSDAAQPNDNSQDGNQGTPEKRERRSRDRYGRDRRERHANNDIAPEENASHDAVNSEPTNSEAAPAPRSYFERGNAQSSSEAVPASQAVSSPASAAPTLAPVEVPAGLPKVQKYELPIGSLIQVAESSGLQWVNSDPEKIALVQAAIAAEPKPVHVPRERPPAVVFDEGPLILVETRKDLSDMKLPF